MHAAVNHTTSAARIPALKRISFDNDARGMYLRRTVKVMARAYERENKTITLRSGTIPGSHRAALPLRALFVAALALLLICSCQSPDPVMKEKGRTLTPDERYLVDYYMKILEFEKYLHDNPGSGDEKRSELEKGFDRQRIRRTLAELQKRPERWLAIYNRINELQLRVLQNQPTGQY